MPIAFHLFSLLLLAQQPSDTSSKYNGSLSDTATLDYQALNEAYEAELNERENLPAFWRNQSWITLERGFFYCRD